MKTSLLFTVCISILVMSILFASNYSGNTSDYVVITPDKLISDNSHENYTKIMDVLTSPRCINCHPNDNIPKQGDDSHPHYFGIKRGVGNSENLSTKCNTCHQVENNSYSGVPGAPEWNLAPAKMAWQGLSRKEIATSMMDPKRNGGRTPEETKHHLTEHELVLWAWNPGVRADGTERKKPPIPLEEYKKAVKEWIKNGAIIPED